jgi:hypothetical protein
VFLKLPLLYQGKQWPMSDFPLWIELSHEGKIMYLPMVTAHYRVLTSSASHGNIEKEIKFYNARVEICKFYAQHYGVDFPEDGYTKSYYTNIVKSACKHYRPDIAKNYYQKAKSKGMLSTKLRIFYVIANSKLLNHIYQFIFS